MQTALLIIPNVRDEFADFKKAITEKIKAPWTVSETVDTPFGLEAGEQLVIAVTKYTPGVHTAEISYTVLPLSVIDAMRAAPAAAAPAGKEPAAVEPEVATPPAKVVAEVATEETVASEPTEETSPPAAAE